MRNGIWRWTSIPPLRTLLFCVAACSASACDQTEQEVQPSTQAAKTLEQQLLETFAGAAAYDWGDQVKDRVSRFAAGAESPGQPVVLFSRFRPDAIIENLFEITCDVLSPSGLEAQPLYLSGVGDPRTKALPVAARVARRFEGGAVWETFVVNIAFDDDVVDLQNVEARFHPTRVTRREVEAGVISVSATPSSDLQTSRIFASPKYTN